MVRRPALIPRRASGTLLMAVALGCAPLAAESLPTMAPTPPMVPTPQTSQDLLVDRVIPAYGLQYDAPYRQPSRVRPLTVEIGAYSARVQAEVLANDLSRNPDRYVRPEPVDPVQRFPARLPVLVTPELLAEEEALLSYAERLAVTEEETPLPNIYERWQMEAAWRDLYRAGETLALAIGDERYANLEMLHRAWKDHYNRLIQLAIFERANEIIGNPETKQSKEILLLMLQGVARAEAEEPVVPYPAMKLDPESDPYPTVALPVLTGYALLEPTERIMFVQAYGEPGVVATPEAVDEAAAPEETDEPAEAAPAEEGAVEELPEEAAVEEGGEEALHPWNKNPMPAIEPGEPELEPIEESSTDGAAPMEEAPVEEEPLEEIPVEDEPVEEAAPVEEAPADSEPVPDGPVFDDLPELDVN
jgi:hypothetical protein